MLLAGKYGHRLHVWDLRSRRHRQVLDLGAEQQMVLELRPAHDPAEAYGFVGVVTSLKDLSASVWLWYRDNQNGNREFQVRKVIEIPAEPADPESLPPAAEGVQSCAAIRHRHQSFARRPLSCTSPAGEPANFSSTTCRILSARSSRARCSSVAWCGVRRIRASRIPPLNGGPQMVEISRDGRRVYVTNSLYSTWDDQFYPDGIRGWMAKVDVGENGGIRLDRGVLAGVRWDAAPPSPPRRRGRFFGFLLLLGVSHGQLNTCYLSPRSCCSARFTGSTRAWAGCSPSRLGCRSGGCGAVWRALIPLTLGHALAIAAAVLVAVAAGAAVPVASLRLPVAATLAGIGRLQADPPSPLQRRRHAGWNGRTHRCGRF